MKKFFVLLKKEVRELLTPQMLVPLVMVVFVFGFIGKIAGSETKKAMVPPPVVFQDQDNSQASAVVKEALGKQLRLIDSSGDADALLSAARTEGAKAVVVIPAGFGKSLETPVPQKLEQYTILNNFSFTGSRGAQGVAVALASANEALSSQILAGRLPGASLQSMKNPVQAQESVAVGDKVARTSLAQVSGFIQSQTTFIPIILFLVITLSSQLIALSMATEKENKTLETLLSAPVDRKAVVAAKLVAAGLVALLNAVIYMVGMRSYINGVTGNMGQVGTDATTQQALQQLGLSFTATDYAVLGGALFLAILVALSIAVILGAFAEDSKSAQGVTTPLMMLVLIPYFLTLFLDISSLSQGLRWLVYAIPFSHAFLAAPNLMLGRMDNVLLGMAYLAVVFVVFVVLAARLFASDKILTLKLNFFKKR